MKFFATFFISIVFFSCSTSKQFINKWTGKTDQEVVNQFGQPDSVTRNEIKGKTYYFKEQMENKIEINKPKQKYFQKYIFIFDSANKVYNCQVIDTLIKHNGNTFIKRKN